MELAGLIASHRNGAQIGWPIANCYVQQGGDTMSLDSITLYLVATMVAACSAP